jgi:hypothetical protein
MRATIAKVPVAPVAIAAVWAASLALPAVEAAGRVFSGLDLLLRGWEGAPRGVYAWFANPLFVIALVASFSKRDAAATVLAGLAAVLGATSFFTEDLLRSRMSSVPRIQLEIGFYVWLAALVALVLRSLACVLKERRLASRQHADRS